MEDYEKINKEIQDFLSVHPYSEYKNEHRPISKEIDNKDNLLFLLESLQSLYNEINTNLKYGNEQGIKDALLKNDIKIALVNDSLISTLKNTIQEKNTLLNENKKLIQLKNEYEESQLKSKYYSQKLENDINYNKVFNLNLKIDVNLDYSYYLFINYSSKIFSLNNNDTSIGFDVISFLEE